MVSIVPQRPGKRRRSASVYRRGFTLIELLVVLVIIGLLAGTAAPLVMTYLGSSRTKAARLQIENLAAGLDLYRLKTGHYPTTDQGLVALIERPDDVVNWNGPYLRKRALPLDPWGRAYQYRLPGDGGAFEIASLGADDLEGGEGENQDVVSWE